MGGGQLPWIAADPSPESRTAVLGRVPGHREAVTCGASAPGLYFSAKSPCPFLHSIAQLLTFIKFNVSALLSGNDRFG